MASENAVAAEPSERKKAYARYLNSEGWKRTAALAREYYGNNCVLCGRSKEDGIRLAVHHRVYEDEEGSILGREKLSQLTLLCFSCHNAATEWLR